MVRLITYNVQYLVGGYKGFWQYFDLYHLLNGREEISEKMIEYLSEHSPDVLSLIEMDSGSKRVNHEDKIQKFGERLDMQYKAHSVKYGGKGFSKMIQNVPILKNQENAVLSSIPMQGTKYHYLSRGAKKMVIETTLSDHNLTLFVVHLSLTHGARKEQMSNLSDILKEKKKPYVVMGDFNSFRNDELQVFKEENGLEQAYERAGLSRENKTAPSWNPRYALDHVLVSDDIDISTYKVLDVHFSDHLPVLVDINM